MKKQEKNLPLPRKEQRIYNEFLNGLTKEIIDIEYNLKFLKFPGNNKILEEQKNCRVKILEMATPGSNINRYWHGFKYLFMYRLYVRVFHTENRRYKAHELRLKTDPVLMSMLKPKGRKAGSNGK